MGIFRAVSAAVKDTLDAQWKELFVCDRLPDELLMVRGVKRISNRSANSNMGDNTITNGSLILIADGQAAVVVSNGRVIASCMEPGEYTFEDPEHPTGLRSVFHQVGERVAFGGDAPPLTQRVYYLNTREVMNVPFSLSLPAAVGTGRGGTELDASTMCSGFFSYRVADPGRFYKMVAGNVSQRFGRAKLDEQLRSELLTVLQTVIAESGAAERPSALPEKTEALALSVRERLAQRWPEMRGLEPVSVTLSGFGTPDAALIRPLQAAGIFLGEPEQTRGTPKREPEESWTCICGTVSKGKFCPDCGSPRPVSWTCSCGSVNTGKFCPECGRAKPVEWTCVCGSVNKGKFCPECGRAKPE